MKILTLSLLLTCLTACGMTGELYLPEENSVDSTVEKSVTSTESKNIDKID